VNALGIVLVDVGIAAGFLGLVSLVRPLRFLGIRSRRRAAGLIGLGALLGLAGMALPAPLRRAEGEPSLLDGFVPMYQSVEFHETRVHAPRERVYRAILEVTADEIWLFRTLTWLRSPRLAERAESILNPGGKRPILEVATSSGFLKLAEDPGREIVVGTIVVAPPEARRYSGPFTPHMFAALDRPGFAKAGMNFRVQDEGNGWCRVTTETRVYATDTGARQRFAAYWRIIYPGSAFIRVMWLKAIRERAQGRL
jgi:hypothetical protein